MRSVVAPTIKLIVFALVTAFATALLAITISSSGSGNSTSGYGAVFTDDSLLQVGDDVRLAGVRIGHITDISVDGRDKAMVHFQTDGHALPRGTQLYVRYRNLTGTRYLAVERGAGVQGASWPAGHVFGTDPNARDTHPALNLTDLFNGFRPVFKQLSPADVNKLSGEIIAVFQGEGATMSQLVSDTATLTNAIADRDQAIGNLITNLTRVLATVNRDNDQFDALLDNTEELVTGLAAQRNSIGTAINSISNLTTITGSLLTQSQPSLESSIAGIKGFADTLNRREKEVSQTLTNWPIKLERLGRSATFGSWFQFYSCGVDFRFGTGRSPYLTKPTIPIPEWTYVEYQAADSRCWKDGKVPGLSW